MLRHLRRMVEARPNEQPAPDLEDHIEAASNLIIGAWSSVCEQHGLRDQIIDETELPCQKELIFNALLVVVARETDMERLKAITQCAPLLAHFQPNIGASSLWPNGADTESSATFLQGVDELGIAIKADTRRRVIEMGTPDPDNQERFRKLRPTVQREAKQIAARIDQILQSRYP